MLFVLGLCFLPMLAVFGIVFPLQASVVFFWDICTRTDTAYSIAIQTLRELAEMFIISMATIVPIFVS